MTGKTDPIQKQASKEATDWLVLLEDDPENVRLQGQFETWLRKSPVNAAAWAAMQQASKAMDKATPVHAERWKPALAELRGETRGDGARAAPVRFVGTRHSRTINRRRAIRFGGIAAAALQGNHVVAGA